MNTRASKNVSCNIGPHTIGYGRPPLLVAEIGINHNGSLLRAKELVLEAKNSGVRVVKFQKRDLASLYTEELLNDTSDFEQGFQYLIPILKRCELSDSEMEELQIFTEALGMTFLCTPFDLKSARFLEKRGVSAYKVSSADLTNMPLIEEIASFGKPMLLSTGMSTDQEVSKTVDFLRSQQADFLLLHCVSSYPVDPQRANLERIRILATKFKTLTGYSGHEIGTSLSLLATSFGACLIEKHFTTDRTLPGPDHKFSLLPEELQRLAARLREENVPHQGQAPSQAAEKVDILQGEFLNKQIFRKGVVAKLPIKAGEPFTQDNMILRSPGGPLTGQDISELLGKCSPRAYRRNEPIMPLSSDITVESQEDENPSGETSFSKIFSSLPEGLRQWRSWGLVVRYHDFEQALPENPPVLEFHLTEKDTTLPLPKAELEKHREQLQRCILRVHCCEYLPDRLFDLCAAQDATRKLSLEMLQRVLDITKELSTYFSASQPAVVFNCGAMTLEGDKRKVQIDQERFFRDILSLENHGILLLAQNMPPYPWYYGGQWKGHYLLEPEELVQFSKRTGHALCLDLSHAAMAARYLDIPLTHYISLVKPYVRHIHLSDATSIEGEGTQIGAGTINFREVIPLFDGTSFTWLPEIWQGHVANNLGAKTALRNFHHLLERSHGDNQQRNQRENEQASL